MSEVVMPRLSDTMEEGELSKWLKNVGDPVAKGDILAEIETDKATMDLEAFESGVLEQQLVEAGTVVAIGQPVAIIGDGSGKSVKKTVAPPAEAVAEQPAAEPAEPAAKPAEVVTTPTEPATARVQAVVDPDAKPRSSPLARKVAREHGVEWDAISGTGPQGRVVRADVEAAIARSASGKGSGSEEVPVSRIRRVAVRRLTESQAVPHFFLTGVADVTRLLEFRGELNESIEASGIRVSVNDLMVRAAAIVLREFPRANASWVVGDGDPSEGKLVQHASVNVGIAVATEAGLLVPVVANADTKPLVTIAGETVRLAEGARAGKLKLTEMSGGTFSISNLGMFGIEQFTAIINPPEAAILAVGTASQVPVLRDGELASVSKLRLTLTVDHRVMDGAVAAEFLRDLVSVLEHPLRLLI